MNSANLKIVKI